VSLPLIGLTTSRSTNTTGIPLISITEAYIQAVLRAGGLPILIPVGLSNSQTVEIYTQLQGLLVTGGGDIDPALYGGVPHPRVYDVDPQRDALEIALVQQAARNGLPFFGICRGIQVINVALGGKLYTDINDQHAGALRHDMAPGFPRDLIAHPVEIRPGSCLAGLAGLGSLQVNSLHHQGIRSVASPLQATAFAPDGLVEAVELPGHPFALGVQWHPEWLPESIPMQAIFRGFVAAAGNGKSDASLKPDRNL
jgi:putative glutamine amidotransferase